MAKKKKQKKDKKVIYGVGVLLVAVAIGGAAWFLLPGGRSSDYGHALGGEKRQTMSPGHFIGKTGRAYRVAREIPEVLDKVYCYCKCQENHGHKSLKTCFVDRHGSVCGICMDEALMSYDLYKRGYDPKKIVEEVNAFFAKNNRT